MIKPRAKVLEDKIHELEVSSFAHTIIQALQTNVPSTGKTQEIPTFYRIPTFAWG